MDKVFRKNFSAFFITILLVVLSLIVINFSYAYFTSTTTNAFETLTISSKVSCLTLQITDMSSLEINNGTPITDENALQNNTPVTYRVTNHCQSQVAYNLGLTSLSEDDNTHILDNQMRIYATRKEGTGTAEGLISEQYLSEVTPAESGEVTEEIINNEIDANSILSTYENRNIYILDSVYIPGNTTMEYKIYLWIDYYEGDTTHAGLNTGSTTGKYFKSTLNIVEDAESYDMNTFYVAHKDFDGTEYIDTNIQLFTQENYMKNFELGFTVDNIDPSRFRSGQVDTIFSDLYESSPYPGILFRIQDSKWRFQAGNGIATNKKLDFDKDSIQNFRVRRVGGKIYYSVNGGKFTYAADLSTLSRFFDTPLTFGVAFDANGNPKPERYLIGGISDMYIRFVDNFYEEIDRDIEQFIGTPLTLAYSSPGSHTFNGQAANVINTGLSLFSTTNYQKSWVVTFYLDVYGTQTASQATLFNAKDETNAANDWPGIMLRRAGTNLTLAWKDGTGATGNVTIPTTAQRINIIKKGTDLYYQYDENEILPIGSPNSFANFDPSNCFNLPVLFGSTFESDGVAYDRYFIGQMSEITIKMSAS